jgi:hypothetical protein
VRGARRHYRGPHVRIAQTFERLIPGGGEQGDRPRAVVGGQGEHGEGADISDDRRAERWHPCAASAEEARVIDESRFLGLIDDRADVRLRQPARQRRPPAHRVDDQVGANVLAVVGSHTAHVWRDVEGINEEFADKDAAP